MGAIVTHDDGTPACRADGLIEAHSVPAGFLKLTRKAVNRFMREWPELVYDEPCHPSIDLFNHGASGGTWYGEDYAFARRWREKCGKIWLVPDLQIDHNTKDQVFPGHYHNFLCRQSGGSHDPAKEG